MGKCRDCGEAKASYLHVDGSDICSKCMQTYYSCTECGKLFDKKYFNGEFLCGDCSDNNDR